MKYIEASPEFTSSDSAAVEVSPEPPAARHTRVRGSLGAAALAVEVRQRLAINISRLADGRELSIDELSEASGVDRRELNAVLAKSIAPTLDWLCRVAAALGVDPMVLVASKSTTSPRRPRPSVALADAQRAEFMLDISVR